VNSHKGCIVYFDISIPSGAIKSKSLIVPIHPMFRISIPSGAIKRIGRLVPHDPENHFNSFWCD